MLTAEQRFHMRRPHQLLQDQPHDVVIKEPLPVLVAPPRSAFRQCRCGCGGMPNRIVGAQAQKPGEQQVVVELLKQQPLGAHPVESLQQRGQQELIWRHRGVAF